MNGSEMKRNKIVNAEVRVKLLCPDDQQEIVNGEALISLRH